MCMLTISSLSSSSKLFSRAGLYSKTSLCLDLTVLLNTLPEASMGLAKVDTYDLSRLLFVRRLLLAKDLSTLIYLSWLWLDYEFKRRSCLLVLWFLVPDPSLIIFAPLLLMGELGSTFFMPAAMRIDPLDLWAPLWVAYRLPCLIISRLKLFCFIINLSMLAISKFLNLL